MNIENVIDLLNFSVSELYRTDAEYEVDRASVAYTMRRVRRNIQAASIVATFAAICRAAGDTKQYSRDKSFNLGLDAYLNPDNKGKTLVECLKQYEVANGILPLFKKEFENGWWGASMGAERRGQPATPPAPVRTEDEAPFAVGDVVRVINDQEPVWFNRTATIYKVGYLSPSGTEWKYFVTDSSGICDPFDETELVLVARKAAAPLPAPDGTICHEPNCWEHATQELGRHWYCDAHSVQPAPDTTATKPVAPDGYHIVYTVDDAFHYVKNGLKHDVALCGVSSYLLDSWNGATLCPVCEAWIQAQHPQPVASAATATKSDDAFDKELAEQGLRRTSSDESGWYVTTSLGKVWATDLPAEMQPVAAPVASAAAHTTTDLHFDKQGGVTIVEQKGLQCPECDGAGRVLGLNNRVRNCSKCHGKGVLSAASAAGGPTKGAKLTKSQRREVNMIVKYESMTYFYRESRTTIKMLMKIVPTHLTITEQSGTFVTFVATDLGRAELARR